MPKIFLTADNHLGRRYDSHPAREKIAEARLFALKDMISAANGEGCRFFAICGDLFDRVEGIPKKLIKDVCAALSDFSGTVLVLPGNHDYYGEGIKLWKDFEDEAAPLGNIVLLKDYKEYRFDSEDGEIAVYPACCRSKHSRENALGWIKSLGGLSGEGIKIGMAHGAIEGVSPDGEEKYFKMTLRELEDIPVDLWLLGHTHIPYPESLSEDTYTSGHKIFNAGTHVQTDLGCNTEGFGFIIKAEKGEVAAKKYRSGNLFFKRLYIESSPEKSLYDVIFEEIKDFERKKSSIEIKLRGSASREDYSSRGEIYDRISEGFMEFSVDDGELYEQLTERFIKDSFAETSLPARLLTALLDEPAEAQMLYELIKESGDAR